MGFVWLYSQRTPLRYIQQDDEVVHCQQTKLVQSKRDRTQDIGTIPASLYAVMLSWTKVAARY
jgi:hypothetical protein